MRKQRHLGFTLIELMVAVTILAILVGIVSTIFHQSSIAWDSGNQRMQANVTARAVLNFMASELSHAVASPDFEVHVDTRPVTEPVFGAAEIVFWTLLNTNSADKRVVRRILYARNDADNTITREEWWVRANDDYGNAISNPVKVVYPGGDSQLVLAENVEELRFHGWPSRGSGDGYSQSKTNLPRGVNIRLGLTGEDDISNVEAWSAGPDRIPGNEDDIGSW